MHCTLFTWCYRRTERQPRQVFLGRESSDQRFPPNDSRSQKHSLLTFIPFVLAAQFKFFLNLYLLAICLTQCFPDLRIGPAYTYYGPLLFVLCITLIREAVDEYRRYRRDTEINSRKYRKLTRAGIVELCSNEIKVSDLIIVGKNQTVPADMIFLRTTERSGTCFIKTDQLDGETDWKLRIAVPATQTLDHLIHLVDMDASIYAEAPKRVIDEFHGWFTRHDRQELKEPLAVENTLWANTVVTSGTAVGCVIYSGTETRSMMNNNESRNKLGLLDLEVDVLVKVCVAALCALAVVMVLLKGLSTPWWKYLIRYVVLFSYIVPTSLRANLDIGKVCYSYMIQADEHIPSTVVRSTTIPEELGRISYLLSDKTGTLTKNEMIFKKLQVGDHGFDHEKFGDVRSILLNRYDPNVERVISERRDFRGSDYPRKSEAEKVNDAVLAIALCHNVTPVYENANVKVPESSTSDRTSSSTTKATDLTTLFPTRPTRLAEQADSVESDDLQAVLYQASSPDEVALVQWTESVGLSLVSRSLTQIKLRTPHGYKVTYIILETFPFTSDRKRMGIIVRNEKTNEITYLMKGADTVMSQIVQHNDWLEEECDNLAREGLRTLVFGKKTLTAEMYAQFQSRLLKAKLVIQDRQERVNEVLLSLERDLELVCLTGVEDQLQTDVRPTLEILLNAGIKIWMLTGDKLETATTIAKSSRLVPRTTNVHVFAKVTDRNEVHEEMNAFRRKDDAALVIDGSTLEICLNYYSKDFMNLACQSVAVVCCRCSPTQKACVVELIKKYTGKRTAAIGDGGNDVSMIRAADAGIGIVGKEGRQASLAADFSITQFSHVSRLLLVHGRYSYIRSAALTKFIIHRGLIISVMQAVFSAIFYFAAVAIYQGFLMVGYATVYTVLPVISMVLDMDVRPEVALTYPELYRDLQKGRWLSSKTFFIWTLVSIYQGATIMIGVLTAFENELSDMVAISFTALILTELIMVAFTIQTWHWLMLLAQLASLGIYAASVFVLDTDIGVNFIRNPRFVVKVTALTFISCLPLYILRYLHQRVNPPAVIKLQE